MAFQARQSDLEKWTERDLKVESRADGSLTVRFAFEGSPCHDGGHPFDSAVVVVLQDEGAQRWRIADVRVEANPDDLGWKATCIHESSRSPDPASLTANSPATGMLLDEFLGRDWPIDDARCFCTSTHVTHKLLLALSTARHWLDHRAIRSLHRR